MKREINVNLDKNAAIVLIVAITVTGIVKIFKHSSK